MAGTKHSKQRDALIDELCSRYDHPTAEVLYMSLKSEFPNLSLGTVYRNLGMLCSDGSIMKISVDGADRYDGNPKPHCHFLCSCCGKMSDIHLPDGKSPFNESLISSVNGQIESYSLTLCGICDNCKPKQ